MIFLEIYSIAIDRTEVSRSSFELTENLNSGRVIFASEIRGVNPTVSSA